MFFVIEKTIRNCFEKSGFFINEPIQTEEQTNDYFEKQWSVVCDHFHINESFQTFANFDDNLAITGQLSEADIIDRIADESASDEENENKYVANEEIKNRFL